MNKLYLHLYKNFGLTYLGAFGMAACKMAGVLEKYVYIIPAVITLWGMIGACYNLALLYKAETRLRKERRCKRCSN